MESKRAVIYARYSSSRQREESIERQIEICNDYAVAHNMLVIGSYVDRKKTGKTDTRPDFQRMIYESSKHLFDIVLVWRYDRFARNLDDHGAYERLLHQNSVDLISATEEIPEGSHSAIIKAVILGGNESYSVELAAKVSDGMHRAAMQGQTSGGPRVFGYRVVDKHYVLDEGEAQIIRQIFTWYDQGKSMTEIVNQLNAQGAVNAAGKPFIISVMRRILTNQMYIGIRLYKGEDIGIRVPAIIDKELFDRVQIQVGKNKCAPARNKPLNDQYLLTTKLFCAQCGSTMSGISGISKNGSKYQYYSCTNRSNKKGCTKHYIGKEVLETAVVDTVKKVLLANNIPELAKAVVKCCNDAQDNGNLLKLESELREVNKGINNLLDLIEAGRNSQAMADRLEQREQQKKLLEQNIAKEKVLHRIPTEDEVIFFFNNFIQGNIDSLEYNRYLIDILVNSIYLSDEEDVVKKKVMSMFTDPNHLRVEDPGQVEGNPVFIYLDAFCKDEYFEEFWPEYKNLDELKAHYQRGGLGDVKVKKFLNKVLQAELAPIRARRKEWEQKLPKVFEILKEGSRVAEAKAAETLNDVREAMKINYFDGDFALN